LGAEETWQRGKVTQVFWSAPDNSGDRRFTTDRIIAHLGRGKSQIPEAAEESAPRFCSAAAVRRYTRNRGPPLKTSDISVTLVGRTGNRSARRSRRVRHRQATVNAGSWPISRRITIQPQDGDVEWGITIQACSSARTACQTRGDGVVVFAESVDEVATY